jgi:hypothetical protein
VIVRSIRIERAIVIEGASWCMCARNARTTSTPVKTEILYFS